MTLEGSSRSYHGNNSSSKAGKIINRKVEFVQRYTNGDLLAEAIIIGNKPYFAVTISRQLGNHSEGVAIILQESITQDTNSTVLVHPRFIDYYNLISTNPYRPTSDFISSFPYNRFDVDTKLIENSIRIEEEKTFAMRES